MTWLNSPTFSIDEAKQRGIDVYEVLYKDWGMTDPIANPGQWDQWPPQNSASIAPSLAAVAIGPRSTVDRAWMTYNLQKNLQTLSGAAPPTERYRQFSVDAPLFFAQTATGNPGSTNYQGVGSPIPSVNQIFTMAQLGSMFVWPFSSLVGTDGTNFLDQGFADVYLPRMSTTMYASNTYLDINLVSRPLKPPANGSIDVNSGEQLNWIGPVLHLLLYLKPPIAMPTKRDPLKTTAAYASTIAANAEGVIATVATFGRRSGNIMVIADQLCDFRIAALRTPAYGLVLGTVLDPAMEEAVDSAAGVAANTPVVLSPCQTTAINADYIIIYCTPRGAGSPTVKFTLTAQD